MSAIVGLFFRDGRPVDRRVLQRMGESVAHRGPDKADAWAEANVGLGHRMLWTTPESLREELPLIDKSGNLVITADARIDNRNELIASLGLSGRPHEKISDSELILGAYEKWGEDCPKRLQGDFVFAVWDRRRQVLFCARDHIGAKPFYYYLSDEVFAFGSEIEALLCVPEVPRRLNEARVADLLVHNVSEKTATFYEEMFRLTPAHRMLVGRDKTSTTPYWAPDPSREIRLSSDEEYAEAFREVFTEAVRCRLRSAFPVGSELSGGLDSSSVACVARDLLAEEGVRQLHTLSAVYKEAPQSDEGAFIDAVLAKGGFESHKVQVELLSPLQAPRSVLWDADEPSILGGLSMPWGLAREASQHGVRVLLNGYDGDVVVSHGIERLAELASTGRWGTLAAEIDAWSSGIAWSRRRILRSWVLEPLAPEFALRAWRMLHGTSWSRTGQVYAGPIREDFARRIDLNERIRASMNVGGDVPKSVRLSRREHYSVLLRGSNQYLLEVHGKIGAKASIETRYPFYDRRLMEFCLALPPEQKLSRGMPRAVLRRALAGVLPDKVQWRTDKGSLTPGLVWSLLMFDRKLVEDTIYNNHHDIERYADLDKLWRRYIRCVVDQAPQAGHVLGPIRTVALALWLRRAGFS
jgi:asparagine synthase (glutamine-hydrolysing)